MGVWRDTAPPNTHATMIQGSEYLAMLIEMYGPAV